MPDEALGAGAERRDDAGDAGRIPRAEVEVALELQLGVEIDDAPRLAGGRLGVRLRAAALERRERDRARGQRLREALVDVLLSASSSGPRAAAGEQQRDRSDDRRVQRMVSLR